LQGCSFPSSNQTNQLNVALENSPTSLDPRKANDLFSMQVQSLLYRGLFKEDKSGNIIFDLVKSYSIASNKTIIVKLKDALWSNGERITAYDFEKNIKEALSPGFVSTDVSPLYVIKNARKYKQGNAYEDEVKIWAKSDNTLIIELEKPSKNIAKLLTPLIFSPYRDDAYSGPYYIHSHHMTSFLTLKKNPKYNSQSSFMPQIIKFSFINDSNLCTQMFLNGELDLIGFPYSSVPSSYKKFISEQYSTYKKDVLGIKLLSFNCKGTFKDKNMRKAFSCAINREDIVKNITQQSERIANKSLCNSLLNEKIIFNIKDIKKNITLIYANDENNHLIAQHIQKELYSKLKININLRKMELPTLWKKLIKKEYDVSLVSWFADYPDYQNIFERLTIKNHHKNHTGFNTKNFFEDTDHLLKEEFPIYPLFQWNFQIFAQSKIKNICINSSGIVLLDKIIFNR